MAKRSEVNEVSPTHAQWTRHLPLATHAQYTCGVCHSTYTGSHSWKCYNNVYHCQKCATKRTEVARGAVWACGNPICGKECTGWGARHNRVWYCMQCARILVPPPEGWIPPPNDKTQKPSLKSLRQCQAYDNAYLNAKLEKSEKSGDSSGDVVMGSSD